MYLLLQIESNEYKMVTIAVRKCCTNNATMVYLSALRFFYTTCFLWRCVREIIKTRFFLEVFFKADIKANNGTTNSALIVHVIQFTCADTVLAYERNMSVPYAMSKIHYLQTFQSFTLRNGMHFMKCQWRSYLYITILLTVIYRIIWIF